MIKMTKNDLNINTSTFILDVLMIYDGIIKAGAIFFYDRIPQSTLFHVFNDQLQAVVVN